MFFISTYIPRLNKAAKLKEFTNKHHLEFAKFGVNNDLVSINDFFNNTLLELLINKDIYHELTCVDKFIIWLDLYRNCINDSISLLSKSIGENINVRVSDIINKINKSDISYEKDIYIDDISITLNAPCNLYSVGVEDMFNNIIYLIKSNNETFNFQKFTDSEKSLFLSSLPVHLFDEFIEFYNSLNNEIIDILPQNDIISFDPINVSVTNGSMFAFIRSILDVEIRTHFNNALVFCKQFNSSYNSYYDITLRDFMSLYKIYESHISTDKIA
jgi:hypothetical protein